MCFTTHELSEHIATFKWHINRSALLTNEEFEINGVDINRDIYSFRQYIEDGDIKKEKTKLILDLFKISGLQPEIKEIQENYIPDGLHPNDNGNAVIAHKLKKFLEML